MSKFKVFTKSDADQNANSNVTSAFSHVLILDNATGKYNEARYDGHNGTEFLTKEIAEEAVMNYKAGQFHLRFLQYKIA